MTYRGTISLSRAHLTHLAEVLHRHRKAIGSRWRRLSPGRQALLALAHLRNGDTYQRLATSFRVGVATVYRYVKEAIDLLAARAPTLTAALWKLLYDGCEAVLDGTLVRIDRLAGRLNRLYYSGKHKCHGVNLQALVHPDHGDLLWVSDGLPGSTHDLTAARTHGIISIAANVDVDLLGDKGYVGAGGTVITPHKGRKLTRAQQADNRRVNRLRAPGERGFATLKTWRIFAKVRCDPARVGAMAKAVLALELGPNA